MRSDGIAALDLVRRGVGQIGAVTFAGVDHQHAGARAASSTLASAADRRLEPRHVVAERRAEAAGLQKVALHVDDDERRAIEIDRQRRRFGLDRA